MFVLPVLRSEAEVMACPCDSTTLPYRLPRGTTATTDPTCDQTVTCVLDNTQLCDEPTQEVEEPNTEQS